MNVAADALPHRTPFVQAWRGPLVALSCAVRLRPHRAETGANSAENTFCHRKYVLRTVLTWLVAVALGLLAYTRIDTPQGAGIVALYAWYLLAVAIIDLEHRRVLNRMLVAALPVVLLVILTTGMPGFLNAIYGAAIGFGVFLLAALLKPGGMGMGDVKLAGLIGLATGVAGVSLSIVVGIIAGGVVALALLVYRRFDRRTTYAYAPYLVLGAWIALYSGADLWRA